MPSELWKLDATAQAELVRKGAVTPTALIEQALERIRALDPALGAVVELDEGLAEAALNQAPKEGAFYGVPTLLKDLLPYPGWPCTFGSMLFKRMRHVPAEHLPYTSALQQTGLVPIGKSASSEFGLLGSTESAAGGVTRNPWDSRRSAGGSSGGAAAAVAAGLVPVAHASDGGGSIRIPAAINGLFGFLPSRRRCRPATPVAPGFVDLTREHFVTRSVRDSARVLACTEASVPDDPSFAPLGMVRPSKLPRLRVGVGVETLTGSAPAAAGVAAVERAVALLEDLGHEVEGIETPLRAGPDISLGFFTMAGAGMDGMARMMKQALGREIGDDELEPFTWSLIRWYRGLPAGALERARDALERAARAALDHQAKWDVVLSPTLGVPTPELGYLSPRLDREELIARTEAFAAYTPVHNVMGAPAMSVPVHVDEQGMPVGCHFSAMPGADAILLALGYELEAAAPWAGRWPKIADAAAA